MIGDTTNNPHVHDASTTDDYSGYDGLIQEVRKRSLDRRLSDGTPAWLVTTEHGTMYRVNTVTGFFARLDKDGDPAKWGYGGWDGPWSTWMMLSGVIPDTDALVDGTGIMTTDGSNMPYDGKSLFGWIRNHWEHRVPKVGERMYITGRDVWYLSSCAVLVEKYPMNSPEAPWNADMVSSGVLVP